MSTIAKFTISEYDRMIAAGIFVPKEEHHVELIRGQVRQMSPVGTLHAAIVCQLMTWSVRSTPVGQVSVRVQCPIQFDELESLPEPDIVWAHGKDYHQRHPVVEEIQLVVEVSESSLAYDRGEKAQLYAQAGIRDYWVVNLVDRVVEVYREPADRRYQKVRTFEAGAVISPVEFPNIQLAVADLWPQQRAQRS